jgi:purine-binding chemotaxis protein CheW
VAEVVDLKPLSRVFHAPAAIAGVENLRGEVLPVIDLSVLIGEGPSAPTPDSRIVVVREVAGARRRAGVLVDELGVLRELPKSGLEAVPSTLPEATARLVAGIIKAAPPCCVLDVEAILGSEELSSLAADTDDERTT